MNTTNNISNTASAIIATLNGLFDKTEANNVLFEGNAQSIMGTPDFDLTQITFSANDKHIVGTLPRDQGELRHIIVTEKSPMQEQAESIASAIGFCNQWNAYWPDLLTSLKESKIDVFNQGMGNLQADIAAALVGRADAHIKALDEYKLAVENVVKALSANQQVFRKYFDASGAPLDVEKEISKIQAKMADDNAITARGASKQALGVLIITVVVIATALSKSKEGKGGESTPNKPDDNAAANKIIGYSVDLIKDDIKQQSEASKDWSRNFQEYGALVEKLEYDKQIFVVVSHFVSVMTDLASYLSESTTDISDIRQQWNTFGILLADITAEVNEPNGADINAVVAGLTTLNESLVAFKQQLVSL